MREVSREAFQLPIQADDVLVDLGAEVAHAGTEPVVMSGAPEQTSNGVPQQVRDTPRADRGASFFEGRVLLFGDSESDDMGPWFQDGLNQDQKWLCNISGLGARRARANRGEREDKTRAEKSRDQRRSC